MKHVYSKPETIILEMDLAGIVMTSSNTDIDKLPIYTTDPQEPGSAL